MSTQTLSLSDRALSIFVFAAYRQLVSEERVSGIALHDDTGHGADPEGVKELETAGLATVQGGQVMFTDEGEDLLNELLSGMRDKVGQQ